MTELITHAMSDKEPPQTPPAAPPQQIGRRGQLHVWSDHFLADDFYKEYPASLLFRNLEGLLQSFAENSRHTPALRFYL